MKSFHPASGSIVVGVDGSENAERAVTWAAHQADREHRTLTLVYCVDQPALRETAWLEVEGVRLTDITYALDRAGEAVLADAHERALVAAPELRVERSLVDEDPRVALLDLAARAHLVVVGSRGRGPVTSVLGSVSAWVAKRAACPVVVCRPPGEPDGYDPTRAPSADPCQVVVGVDGTPASAPVLDFAFAQASLTGAPLRVMHCFYDVRVAALGYGTIPMAASLEEDLSDLQLLLAESVAGLCEKYPDVVVTTELARGLVDDCLARRSPEAALLVVGRAHEHGLSRFLHSSCAVAVLERATTAVAVVPEST